MNKLVLFIFSCLIACNLIANDVVLGVFGQPVIVTNTVITTNIVTVTNSLIIATGQTNVQFTGEDAYYQAGLKSTYPRFTIGAGIYSNCVIDNFTGLMWARTVLSTGYSWQAGIVACEELNGSEGMGEYSDWRLPNILELISLISYRYSAPSLYDTSGTNQLTAGNPFYVFGVNFKVWSGTRGNVYGDSALTVHMGNGLIYADNTNSVMGIWPVRKQ